MSRSPLRYAVVIPSVGRDSLAQLLHDLADQPQPRPEEVVVVDDRPVGAQALTLPGLDTVGVRVVRGFGRGPAAARNLGWQVTRAPWVAFLDDDVRLPSGWTARLAEDLESLGPRDAASQGRIEVPLPADRRPTDWERATAGLETASWATADMAYRREALQQVHGFDERFPRAYREDADLALRVRHAGWQLQQGRRRVLHPPRTVAPATSVRVQRGNADDALMRRLHGPQWRSVAETGQGRLPWHVATTTCGLAAVVALALARTPRDMTGSAACSRLLRRTAAGAAMGWLALTADFAWRRIEPGPRTREEVTTMVWTSAAIPPVALGHRLAGWWRHRRSSAWPPRPRAVLFDRDGTLVTDVPYNGDPELVEPMPGAAEALAKVRAHGLPMGVVSNQSGIARGLLSPTQVRRVNAAVDRLLGPFDTWQVCPHGADDGCDCRKPQPGLVVAAARDLGVHPRDCVVIGDIGSDVHAARAAGARAVLVPTDATRPEEVADAALVAPDLPAAVDLVLGGAR